MSYICNTPVALIFFTRPDTFEKVFEKVREVKPKKLFLIQDGARNENDIPKILECRKIAENIDWECEVVKDYSEDNLGCGVRPQSGITNALKQVDRLIILEDDCVPNISFFKYCEENLERYKDDDRICYISGLNHFESWDCGESDYFFTKTGAIWGWATWARVWNKYYDYNLKNTGDEYVFKTVEKQITNQNIAEARTKTLLKAQKACVKGEKLSYWDAQWGFVKYSQNMLVIVPKYNLIHNIGIGVGSTHATSLKEAQYQKYKNFVFIPTKELEFPMKHPDFCVCDVVYDDLVYKCSAGNPIKRNFVKIVKKLLGRE